MVATAAALAFIGFFYSSVKGRKPSSVVSISQMKTKLLAERDWINVVAVFILPCVIVYNFFAFLAHGIAAIGEFLVFIASKIRWVVLWIWNEVIIAVVYSLLKLAAHYVFVISWKMFRFACVTVKEAYKKQSFAAACLYTAMSVAALLVAYFAFMFFPYLEVLCAGIFVACLVTQFAVFKATAVVRSVQFSKGNARVSYKTFVLWLVGAVCFTLLAVILQAFASNVIIQSISITLAQILTPLIILFGLAILGASVFLPAYIAENGEDFSVIDFIKAFVVRIPKLIISLPFAHFGVLVATVIPAIIAFVLYLGIVSISQSDYVDYILVTDSIYDKNCAKIENAQAIATLEYTRDTTLQAIDKKIQAAEATKQAAEQAKSIIKHDNIHTFGGDVYEGDTQFFTIPVTDGMFTYTWQISDIDGNVILSTQTGRQGNSQSTGFSTIWQQTGTFEVLLATEDGNTVQTVVNVLPKADKPENETRPPYFVTIDEANQAFANASTEIEIANALAESKTKFFNEQINSMKDTSTIGIGVILPWILASIGYALLLIGLLVMAFIYCVVFFFDLYDYEQQPQYYFQKLYAELQEKNANQPLLGIFALIVAAALCCLCCC
jgi:molybdopterin converting factor small subunit